MSTRELIVYYAGGGAAIIFCLAVSYWSVNLFIRQFTVKSCQRFRESMMEEAERALRLFREGLCEQIVQQENKSDSLAKLYSTLIDLLRVGKELLSAMGGGELHQAEKMLRALRSTGDTFAELYQKQSLHFPDEFCSAMKEFIVQQRNVVQRMETIWSVVQKDQGENSREISEIKQNWMQLEDRVGKVMDVMRNEFRSKNHVGNMMMKWLSDAPLPKDAGRHSP